MQSLLQKTAASYLSMNKNKIFMHKKWLSAAVDDSDTQALYLLLLARAPESDEIYAQNRGRRRRGVIGSIVNSPEFRDRVGTETAAAAPWFDSGSLEFLRRWFEPWGIRLDATALDWNDAFLAAWRDESLAALIRQALPQHAAEIQQRLAARRGFRAALRSPGGDRDVKAAYLLLLHREPESEAIYAANRQRPRIDLIAGIVRSPEFRGGVLERFLAQNTLPRQWLDESALGEIRAWLAGLGLTLADPAGDWVDLFAAFWSEAPAAALAAPADPDAAARLAQKVTQVRCDETWGRSPPDSLDVRAIYLALLGRLPESDDIYASHKSRSRRDLLDSVLRSVEFGEGPLAALLSHTGLPQDRLSANERGFLRLWLERVGVDLAGAGADADELVAICLTERPLARAVSRAFPIHATRLAERLSKMRRARSAGRLPLQDPDVRALYLLLLGRAPESDAIYEANRGRPRSELIAGMLQSPEFRDAVLTPFLARAELPQQRLDEAGLEFVRSWATDAGFSIAPETGDWMGIIAAFLAGIPAATTITAATQRLFEQRIVSELGMSTADRRSRAEVASLGTRLAAVEAGWRQHVPAMLNAVSSVGAFGYEHARLAQEVQALRRDLDRAIERSAGDLRLLSEKIARLVQGESNTAGRFRDLGDPVADDRRQIPTAE